MFKSTKEFDSAVKVIVETVLSEKKLDPKVTSIGEDDYWEALAEAIHRGYVNGISYNRTADGKPHFQLINPRVTYSGLSFIERR